jgi:hypothetical protein
MLASKNHCAWHACIAEAIHVCYLFLRIPNSLSSTEYLRCVREIRVTGDAKRTTLQVASSTRSLAGEVTHCERRHRAEEALDIQENSSSGQVIEAQTLTSPVVLQILVIIAY